jgi:hypothetical protein
MMEQSFKAVSTDNQLVIRGGYLKENDPWAPLSLTIRGGVTYVPLHKKDRRLAAFCGKSLSTPQPLKACGWLDLIVERRDAICAQIVAEMISARNTENDPLAMNSGVALDQGPFKLKDVIDLNLPDTIIVDMPSLDGSDDISIPVIFEALRGPVVQVAATSDVLAHVCAAVHDDDGNGTKWARRHPDDDTPTFTSPVVRWSRTRKAAYVHYTDADGRPHRKEKQMKAAFTAEEVAETEEWLLSFRNNHHNAIHDENVD